MYPSQGTISVFDIVGERALIVRGKDGEIRAFHNVCRHRGSRVVADDQGSCKTALVCPFHGWSFNLDGTFRSAPAPRSLPDLDPVEHGLVPLELEIWMGFLFIRFKPGPQPPVSELMAPVAKEVGLYRCEEMVTYDGIGAGAIPVNWKAVRDVDNEGYHVPIAHPGLQDSLRQGLLRRAAARRRFPLLRTVQRGRWPALEREKVPQAAAEGGASAGKSSERLGLYRAVSERGAVFSIRRASVSIRKSR